MVEFKGVIADPKSGRTYNKAISGHHASSLVGRKVGDEIDGIFVGLPGYKLQITGGSDKDGSPMRRDLPGPRRTRLTVSEGIGFHPKDPGVRKKRMFRGTQISPEILQINMKVTQHGPKSIADSFQEKGETR